MPDARHASGTLAVGMAGRMTLVEGHSFLPTVMFVKSVGQSSSHSLCFVHLNFVLWWRESQIYQRTETLECWNSWVTREINDKNTMSHANYGIINQSGYTLINICNV